MFQNTITMDYKICIPTFNRPKILRERTVDLLRRTNGYFLLHKVILFFENEEQVSLYLDAFEDEWWKKWISSRKVITNTEGIGAKRNFIRKYAKDEKLVNVFCIDDDIDEFYFFEDPVQDLDDFLQTAFKETKKKKLNCWGVSAFHNPFYLKDNTTTNLKYICGAFYGFIVDQDKPVLQTSYNHYEDFEFSILHFIRDGGVLRYNGYAIKTKYFGEGGINQSYGGLENRKKDMKEAGERFVSEYPNYSRLIEKKYGFDIRLNWRAKPSVV